tara:strand:- start:5773 stop:6210 length:438 start_codon:yes stop_codon:yes gene_type:complete
MKSHPLKQTKLTQLDHAGTWHKVKKGIPRALGTIASMLPIGRGVSWLKTPSTNFWKGSTVNFGNIGSKINQSIKATIQRRLNLENKLKYPSSMPKGWNKGGSKQAFDNLKRYSNPNKPMGPSKENIDYILNYSKDFGPIIKNIKK